MDPIVTGKGSFRYNPFEKADISDDISNMSGIFGVTEATSYIQNKLIIGFSIDGEEQTGFPGGRAGNGGFNRDRGFRWMTWITGYSGGMSAGDNNWEYRINAAVAGVTPGNPGWAGYGWEFGFQQTCLRQWYQWGARKFHIHQPFGKVANGIYGETYESTPAYIQSLLSAGKTAMPYSSVYTIDQYLHARDGFVDWDGTTGNDPMPWTTDDIVDGDVQGFVPLFRALTTGSSAGLSETVWRNLTGIGGASAWFNPNEPITLSIYNGTPNYDTYPWWKGYINRFGITAAKERIKEALLPFARIGARLGLDALVSAPGPTAGINGTFSELKRDLFSILDYGATYIDENNQPRPLSDLGVLNPGDTNRWLFNLPTLESSYRGDGAAWAGTSFSYVNPSNGTVVGPLFIPPRSGNARYIGATGSGTLRLKLGITLSPPLGRPIALPGSGFVREKPGESFGTELDQMWWQVFNEWIVPVFGKYNVFAEANPDTFPVGNTIYANPYLGFPVMTTTQFGAMGFGGNSSGIDYQNYPISASRGRQHYRGEFGDVDFIYNLYWGGQKPYVGIHDMNTDSSRGITSFPTGSQKIFLPGGTYESSGNGPYFLQTTVVPPSGTYIDARIRPDAKMPTHGYLTIFADTPNKNSPSGAENLDPGNSPSTDPRRKQFYVRPRSNPGYGESPMIAGLYALNYLRRDVQQLDDPSGSRDITKKYYMMDAAAKLRLPSPNSEIGIEYERTRAGLLATDTRLNDFARNFPTITEYAKYLVQLKRGFANLDPLQIKSTIDGFTEYVGDLGEISRDYAEKNASSRRRERIKKTLWLTLEDYDQFMGTKLSGQSGGAYYVPSVTADVNREYVRQYLDTKVKSFNERNGYAPDYLIWNISEDSRIEPAPRFEMERYLSIPDTIVKPDIAFNLDTWTPANLNNRLQRYSSPNNRMQYYNRLQGQNLVSGYDAPRGNLVSGTNAFPGNTYYNHAKLLLSTLINHTKEWRNYHGYSSKVSVGPFPKLPEYPWPSFSPSGGGWIPANAGTWVDKVWPKQITGGWYTEAETADLKHSLKLEHRKRAQDIMALCEMGTPEEYLKVSVDDIASDENLPLYRERNRETINVFRDLQGVTAWATFIPEGTQDAIQYANTAGTQIALGGKPVIPHTALSILGNADGIIEGDPATTQRGSVFDHDRLFHSNYDWVRDDFLRPKPLGFTAARIQGMSVWNSGLYRAINAMRSNAFNYSGRTADREWVYRWLRAEYGDGATIDWSNSTDVTQKMKQFFDIQRNVGRLYLQRFNEGAPRIDVVEPFKYTPFAASISEGDGSGEYPAEAGGMKITDVVPMLWVGSSTPRAFGSTGSVPSGFFNDFVQRAKKIAKGRRVLRPLYWNSDPVADFKARNTAYRGTSDGGTYSGSNYRSHETPGQVKLTTPWNYVQTEQARQSIARFIDESFATGAGFDFVANDGEGWLQLGLNSTENAFPGPFGSTGMPGVLVLIGVNPFVFSYESALPNAVLPDNRTVHTTVFDSRFGLSANNYNGKTFGADIQQQYNVFISTPILGNIPAANQSPPSPGVTAGEILRFYFLEGPTGISAATGPAYNSSIASEVLDAANPWRRPLYPSSLGSQIYGIGSKSINRRISWYAYQMALKNIIFGDLIKRMWSNSIAGATGADKRKARYSHIDIAPTGITEGVFALDATGNSSRSSENYPWIDPSPKLYGGIDTKFHTAWYHVTPTNDRERFFFQEEQDSTEYETYQFGSGATGAKSYIAMIKEMAVVRAMLRNKPDSWKYFSPWIKSFKQNDLDNGFLDAGTDLAKGDSRYGAELAHHCLLSGAKYFNYYMTDGDGEGFTAGLTFMQTILNEWKQQSGGYRVQPVSTANGRVISSSNPAERIDMSVAGGNHVGATGTVMSGAKILQYARGLTLDSDYGAVQNNDYLWRITAAPQGTRLYRVAGSDPKQDLPPAISLLRQGVAPYASVSTVEGSPSSPATLGEFSDVSVRGGTLSYAYTGSGEEITLLTDDLVADSGAEIRHVSGLPSNYTVQPILIGGGRPTEFQFRGFAVGDPYTGSPLQGENVGGFFGGQAFSVASGAFVGYLDLRDAYGTHLVNADGNLFGMENAVCFFSIGGSAWQTLIVIKDGDEKYNTRTKLLTDYPAGNASTLKIEISESGEEARFYINGTLVDTVNKSTSADEFSIRSSSGALNPSSITPADSKLPKGKPLFAGCAVRNMSCGKDENGYESGDPISGAPGGNGRYGLLVSTNVGVPTRLDIKTKTSDADCFVSNRGAWIKRKAIDTPPRYKIDQRPTLVSTNPDFLNPGSGFPTDKDSVFSQTTTEGGAVTSLLTDSNDLRVIAAWKTDPIPFDPKPDYTTVTVVAYHPSGIQKVEASLDGGPVATIQGSPQNSNKYQEFTFKIPTSVQLSATPAGAPLGSMHEIRAKVFPYTGRARILGGLPDETSRYYYGTGNLSILPDNPTIVLKKDVNETSFFIQNINTTSDTGYSSVIVGDPLYPDIKTAILSVLGHPTTTLTPTKKYLDIRLTSSGTYLIPTEGDPMELPDVDIGGGFVPYLVPDAANKTVRIISEVAGVTLGVNSNGLPESSGSWTKTSYYNSESGPTTPEQVRGTISVDWRTNATFTLTEPSTARSYGITLGRLYRLNKNPFENYNVGFSGLSLGSPSGNASSSANWIHNGTTANFDNAILGSGRLDAYKIGRIKIQGTGGNRPAFDKGKVPNVFSSGETNRFIYFKNTDFFSVLQPCIDPRALAANGNASYENCTTVAGSTLANAFGFSRYVIGCTANGVRGTVFSNASFVRDSAVFGSQKLDKDNNPTIVGRRSGTESGDSRAKKNSIYTDIVGGCTWADVLSLGRNEVATTNKHNIDHMDILYRNINISGPVGMADRVEGYVHNVHLDGISMPNAIVFSPEYRTALASANADNQRYQKLYIRDTRTRMIMNEGQTAGNELATSGVDYNLGFGVGLNTFETSTAIKNVTAQVTPRPPNQISMGIRGIPGPKDLVSASAASPASVTPGNTLSPLFYRTATTPAGNVVKVFGLDMGSGFGPTAQGFTANGLTFASWTRIGHESGFMSPRLCWVYGLSNISWINPDLNAPLVDGSASYENGIASGATTGSILLFGNLNNFFDRNDKLGSMQVDPRAAITWVLGRSYQTDNAGGGGNTARNAWAIRTNDQNVAATGAYDVLTGSPYRHWLNVGNTAAAWTTYGGAAYRDGFIIGGRSGDQGIPDPVPYDGIIRISSILLNDSFATSFNGSSGGMTLADQYGNQFRITSGFSGSGEFTISSYGITFLGANPKTYTDADFGWPDSWLFREWIYNGDATQQYGPINLGINIDGQSYEGLYRAQLDYVPDTINWADMLGVPNGASAFAGATITGINQGITLEVSFGGPSGEFRDNSNTNGGSGAFFEVRRFNNGVNLGNSTVGLSAALGTTPGALVFRVNPGDFIRFQYKVGATSDGDWTTIRNAYSDFTTTVKNLSDPAGPVVLDTFRSNTLLDPVTNPLNWGDVTAVQGRTAAITGVTISGINAPIVLGITWSNDITVPDASSRIGVYKITQGPPIYPVAGNIQIANSNFITLIPNPIEFTAGNGDFIRFNGTADSALATLNPNGFTLQASIINKSNGDSLIDTVNFRYEPANVIGNAINWTNLANTPNGTTVSTEQTFGGINYPSVPLQVVFGTAGNIYQDAGARLFIVRNGVTASTLTGLSFAPGSGPASVNLPTVANGDVLRFTYVPGASTGLNIAYSGFTATIRNAGPFVNASTITGTPNAGTTVDIDQIYFSTALDQTIAGLTFAGGNLIDTSVNSTNVTTAAQQISGINYGVTLEAQVAISTAFGASSTLQMSRSLTTTYNGNAYNGSVGFVSAPITAVGTSVPNGFTMAFNPGNYILFRLDNRTNTNGLGTVTIRNVSDGNIITTFAIRASLVPV